MNALVAALALAVAVAGGRTVEIGDGPTDRTATATSATTAVSRQTYDAAGNLLTVADAKGFTTTYVPNASGEVTGQTGPQPGEVWTYAYDAFGQLSKKTLVRGPGALAGWQGATWQYEYRPSSGATVKETGPGGYTTERWYNARRRLLQEVRKDGGTARSSANERRVLVEWDGPWAKRQETTEGTWTETVTRPSRDHRGRVLEEVESFSGPEASAGYTYTTRVPWAGRVADPVTQQWTTAGATGGRSGRRAVDGLGNVIEQTWGTFTDAWDYDAAGRLAQERLSGKPERVLTYVEGQVSAATYGTGVSAEQTQYLYYGSGKPQAVLEPDGRSRRLAWDERGLLAREEYGTGTSFDIRTYGYDAAGNRSSMTVGAGGDQAAWAYAYGPRGELLSVTQPGGLGVFQYGYDERAALASVAPPAGAGSAGQIFEQDYLGREVVRRRGDATWTTTWANGAGTTVEPTDPTGTRAIYRALDGRGREAAIAWSGVASDLTRVEREYGPHDRPFVARETRGSGTATVTYAYADPRLLLTGVTRGLETVSYGYTASGERGSEQSPSGLVSYRYDGLDRLQYVDSPRGTTQVTWEAGGARVLDVAGPTVTECRRYDERGRLRFIASVGPAEACETSLSPLSRFDYGYDERGNRLREEYQRAEALEVTQYGYDGADRLTSVVSPSGAETRYGLGGDGSRLTETRAATQGGTGTTETYHYDPRGGLTSITDELGAPVATYTVDVAGRVQSEARAEGTKSFTWDAGGRLVSATVQKTLPGGGTVTDTLAYRYDHAGRRIWKQGPKGETTYLWGDGELVDEVLPSGARVRYERAEGMALAAGSEALLHDGLGPLCQRE